MSNGSDPIRRHFTHKRPYHSPTSRFADKWVSGPVKPCVKPFLSLLAELKTRPANVRLVNPSPFVGESGMRWAKPRIRRQPDAVEREASQTAKPKIERLDVKAYLSEPRWRIVATIDDFVIPVTEPSHYKPSAAQIAAYQAALDGTKKHQWSAIGQWLRAIGMGACYTDVDYERVAAS